MSDVVGPAPRPGFPSAEVAVRFFRERFLNRTDKVAMLAAWKKPFPIEGGDNLDGLLRAHVLGAAGPEAIVRYKTRRGLTAAKGRFRIGSYSPGPDNLTRWLCLDLDGPGHAESLADPRAAALSAMEAFAGAGLPAYLERSGSAKGWHLWAFFDPPVEAGKAQALGRALAPKDAPLAAGGVADPRSGKGIEVFPKQARLKKKGYGNLVWLPWWSGASDGGSLFHRVGEAGDLEVFVPEELRSIRPEDLDRVLAALPAPPPPAAKAAREASPSTPPSPEKDGAWSEWRKKALAELPLEAVYGAWLTGKVRPGWLECRDPGSSSGDQDPSAGVADGTGEAERGAFHSFISGKTISVFDFLVERGESKDIGAAFSMVADYSKVQLPARGVGVPGAAPRKALPEIRVNNRQLRNLIEDAWRSAHRANRGAWPTLFARSGALIRIAMAKEGPRIEAMDEAATYGHLARVADWVKVTQDGVFDTSPSRDVARDMLVYPDPSLPVLEAVVTTPVFDQDGNLVSKPGYHPEAMLWFHRLDGIDIEGVPERPSAEEVQAARGVLIEDLLVDFPFTSDSDRAHAVAAMVLPFVRRMVSGCTPIHLLEAPVAGTGKGLLADILAIVALGRKCELTTITRDEDESRKKITSVLARAQSMILIDNVKDGIDSAQLAAALTAEIWSDRLLGQTRMLDLPNKATWVVTGNNPKLSLEIARRCVRVRIDAKVDRPWNRTGFKHTPLRDWAMAHRAQLVQAVLVLVRSWIAAGKPPGKRTLGSFESWAAVVGGIIENAGIPGFLQDTEKLYLDADTEGQEWREFVMAWWQIHGTNWVGTSALHRLVQERDMLGQVVGDKSPRSQLTRLGRALSSMRDRQFGDFRISSGRDSHSKAAQYRVIRVGNEGEVEGAAQVLEPAPSGGDLLDLANFEDPEDHGAR